MTRRPRTGLRRDTRAVSDVVGSILLVSITVLMAISLGGLMLAFDGPQDQQHTKLAITLGPGADLNWGADDAELRIQHLGGEPLPQERTLVHLTPPGGARETVEPVFAGGSLRIGESWTRIVTAFEDDVFQVQVVVSATAGGAGLLASTAVVAVGASDGIPATLTYVGSFTATTGSVANFGNAQSAADGGAVASLVEAALGATVSNLTATTNASSGATNAGNVLVSDDAHATLDANGEWVEAGGFSAPGGATTVTAIAIGVEGKGTTGASGTVTHQQTVTATSSASSTITSPSVTGTAGHVYLASIANGASTVRTVVSVSGLGLTWAHVANVTGSENQGRLEVWLGTGTPSTGTVTATLSGNVDRGALVVARFSGADLTSPVQDFKSAEAPGTGSNTWSTAAVTGSTNGLLFAAVNVQDKNGASFTNPGTKRSDFASGTVVRLATGDGAAASGSNSPSGGMTGGTTDWQTIALTLRPFTPSAPQVRLSYAVGGNPGVSTLTRSLTSTDAHHTLNVFGDRSWTVADISQLAVRVEATSLSGGTALIDRIYATATTTSGPVTFAMDVEMAFAGVPVGLTHTLQLNYQVAAGGDTFAVALWDGAAWRTCTGALSATSLAAYTCSLVLPAEYQGGAPRIRFTDADPGGSTQTTLSLDYVRVAST